MPPAGYEGVPVSIYILLLLLLFLQDTKYNFTLICLFTALKLWLKFETRVDAQLISRGICLMEGYFGIMNDLELETLGT